MKRVLIVAALLTTLTACGGTEPGSDPAPTIEISDTPTTDTMSSTTPTTTTSTTTTTTTPPPVEPVTEVPDVAPPTVDTPAPYTPPAYTPPPAQPTPAAPAGAYYKNCSEARAAGAAPLYRGDPGYRSALDRDNDGVACET